MAALRGQGLGPSRAALCPASPGRVLGPSRVPWSREGSPPTPLAGSLRSKVLAQAASQGSPPRRLLPGEESQGGAATLKTPVTHRTPLFGGATAVFLITESCKRAAPTKHCATHAARPRQAGDTDGQVSAPRYLEGMA